MGSRAAAEGAEGSGEQRSAGAAAAAGEAAAKEAAVRGAAGEPTVGNTNGAKGLLQVLPLRQSGVQVWSWCVCADGGQHHFKLSDRLFRYAGSNGVDGHLTHSKWGHLPHDPNCREVPSREANARRDPTLRAARAAVARCVSMLTLLAHACLACICHNAL